ncbi:MAG: DNA primase noncatalytic subunit PriX [Candidatus Micrarchaeia archaeon]
MQAGQVSRQDLEFAYKYPFSSEAKELIKKLGQNKYEEKFATAALLRVNEALEKSRVEFVSTSYEDLMKTYLISYVYARMLVSATGDLYLIKRFAAAEAERAASALAVDSLETVAKVSNELGIKTSAADSKVNIDVFEFLKFAAGAEGLHLLSMSISNGTVSMSKEQSILLAKSAIAAEILKGLPIPKSSLPGEIIAMASGIRLPSQKIAPAVTGGKYEWIEKLLLTPIPDVRHRSVNLILAPYLVNVRKLDENTAANVIIEYIEKCKQLNPNTRINDSYIKYQCKYAKEHGMRPLSLSRARELFKGVIDL